MRIVDVCAFYTPHGGGVKTYIGQKLAIGPQLGHDITILAPGDDDAVIEQGPHARIITLASPRLPVDRKYWYFNDEPALHAALDAARPDFVEVSSPWRSPSVVARWPGNVPRALVMHADPLSAYAYRWFEPVLQRDTIDRRFGRFWDHLRTLGQSYDRVVCASHDLATRLAQGGVANTVIHPMGIEAGLFSPDRRDPALRRELLALCDLPENALLLIAAGRLAAEKRLPMLVDAVTIAGQRNPVGLVILGEGSQKARIAKQMFGNPHIRLLGIERDRTRFAAMLASADALLHGCEAETFCMAAAEARACGVPVIVPDRGGAADHAANGVGLTYQATSAVAAAEAITSLCEGRWRSATGVPFNRTMTDHFAALFGDYGRLAKEYRRAA
ncbi:MAG: hypothetical protein RL367_638 [Pseudomonadota bacterium]